MKTSTTSGLTVRTSNLREIKAIQWFHSQGYEVINRGWPDLLVKRGNDIKAIEVKRNPTRSRKLKLRKHQIRCHNILMEAGMKVEVFMVR